MIKMQNLNFSFGRKGFALKDINLNLDGGTYALLGSNGSGNTTLMKCLIGAYEYTGKIEVQNKGSIGYLPQNIDFMRDLTAREMLEYIYSMKGLGKKIDKAEIDRCLQLTNLYDLQDKKVRSLSGGMLRRLGVAQAILGDPKALVFDEPTAGLDPEERMRFKNLIYNLNRDDSKVIIVSTHIVDDVVGNCDKVIVLKDGVVLTVGTESEIKSYADGKVYELPSDHHLPQDLYIEKNLEKDGVDYVRVLSSTNIADGIVQPPTLEDGYLCLIKEI